MARKGYKKIGLDDIPRFSKWPARLLGAEPWTAVKRDIKKVEEEYDLGSYARCLKFCRKAQALPTYKQIRAMEFGGDNPMICSSWGNEVFVARLMRAYEDYYNLIARSVLPYVENGITVVELGCGYGFNLAMLKERTKKQAKFLGGEYSDNGVRLAGELLRGKTNISVEKFDFYSRAYPILEKPEGPVVIFTAHSIEQIPDAGNLFAMLQRHKSKIKAVIHIEPVYEFQGEGLLGLLRRRYIEVNDYNRNLFTLIEGRSDIDVIKYRKNVFGINGLNPSSTIEWRFAG